MNKNYIQGTIKGLGLPDPESDPVLHLDMAEGEMTLQMEVGPFEASAILIELEGLIPPRPLTHDLLAQTFRTHKLKPIALYIDRKVEDQFFAHLEYKQGLRKYSMELRPSDGMALSLRLAFPILVHKDILEVQGVPSQLEAENLTQSQKAGSLAFAQAYMD